MPSSSRSRQDSVSAYLRRTTFDPSMVQPTRGIYTLAHQSVSMRALVPRYSTLKLAVLRIKVGMDSVSNLIACITAELQIAFAPHLFRAGPQHSFECGFSYVWKSVVTRYYLAQSHNFLSNYTAFRRRMKRLP
jgi:hypothetical protein